jgi:hypothetical protein
MPIYALLLSGGATETDPGAAFTTAALLDKRTSNPQGAPRKRRVAGAVGDSSTVEQRTLLYSGGGGQALSG